MARVVVNLTGFDKAIAALRNPAKPLVRAINRSANSGKTLGARLVAKDMGLKVSAVKDAIYVRGATENRLEATIDASAKRMPVLDFNARGPEPSRGKGSGVRARTKVGRYPHAFIATVKTAGPVSQGRQHGGHRGVFQRAAGAGRLTIYELFDISIWTSFHKQTTEIQARVQEQLDKNVASEINYALSRAR